MFSLGCPECGSLIKSERGTVETLLPGKVFCSNSWHWRAIELPAGSGMQAPRGWEWTKDDETFMALLDLAFSKPLKQVQKEYYYLGFAIPGRIVIQ